VDGDTISVMHDGRAERVRLEGIDCPEDGHPFGKAAKQATSGLVFGHEVRVHAVGHDRYGRTIGRVYVGDIDVNLQVVRLGLAWHFKRYSSEEALAHAESDARTARRGLWSDPHALPPWEWRRTRGVPEKAP
jgi:endonuclease YncB( thermonuclease family)